jgi:HAE1 family hydrophobic/amphiphilic exporter-1
MVISIVLVLAGAVTVRTLPIAMLPDISPPQVVVSTVYPGADAVAVEQSVATPIEQQMNGVDRMIYLQSTSANDGSMSLRVTFEVGTNPDTANVLVQNRVAQAVPRLPAAVNAQGLSVRKVTASPLVVVALYSPGATYDNRFLANYATIHLTDQLLRVSGVGDVRVFGGADYAMRIWVNPDVLASLGLTVADLQQAVQRQSTINPAGQLGAEPVPKGQEFTYAIRAQGRLSTPEEFGRIIVRANPDGSFVRLANVARIELGTESYNQIGRFGGKPAAIIAVFQQPGSDALAVARGVEQTMAGARGGFPADVADAIAIDRTAPVIAGIDEMLTTLVEALALVMLVVFVFLQTFRATLIPLLTVPVSLVGTFIVFPLFNLSINTLTLFGLVLAIGLVVDDAIVVVEAVQHHIEQGLAPREATLQAMREVSGPVVAIALVLSSVFIPAAFIPGIKGRLFQQFALTIAVSVIISAWSALSLSPALTALLLRPRGAQRQLRPLSWFFARFNRGFGWSVERYVSTTAVLLRKLTIGLVLLGVFVLGALLLGRKLPTGFLPEEDQGALYGNLQLPDAASLQRTDAAMREIEQVLGKTPGVAAYTTSSGFSILTQTAAANSGLLFISLTPWSQRRSSALSVFAISERINRQLAQLPAGRAFTFLPPVLVGIGAAGGFDLMLEDRTGLPIPVFAEHIGRFMAAASKRPELSRLNNAFRPAVPQLYARVDEDRALKQGVDLGALYLTLGAFMGGAYINDFNRFGRQWRVYLEAEGQFRTRADSIARFYVRNSRGQMVPLSTLVTIVPIQGPEFVTRFDLYRAAEITGAAGLGYSSGQAMAALSEVAAQTLPAQMGIDWAGMSYQEKRAGGVSGVLTLSIALVFLILAALYESWSLPFSILLSTPVAICGALLGLLLRALALDVYAQIGLIMLVGLAAKNAILIVEFARAELAQSSSAPTRQLIVDAALVGARRRLRPILMTSFAFILGMLPLWAATGAGAGARRVLGTAVIMGLLIATLFGVFLVPVLFVAVEQLIGRFHSRGAHRP